MKKAMIIVCAVFILFSAVSCKKNEEIAVWSFNDEVERLINSSSLKDNHDFKINFSVIPADQFTDLLDAVLTSGREVPDVFALKADFVRKYVESGLLLDLTDIYERNRNKFYAYPAEIGTFKGRVYAVSWQACPGAVFYRRSFAQKYIGTDNPEIVRLYFADFNLMLRTAELFHERSGGACVITANIDDLFSVFLSARKSPWLANGSLVIDPVMEQYMDMCKTFYEYRYDGCIDQWSEDWLAGMRDELKDEDGRQIEVFAYFLPAWGLHNILETNAPDTSGDWAVIPGPSPYHWGGSWLAAWKSTKNAGEVKKLIEYIISNDGLLYKYAQESGDFINSTAVVNMIKENFSEPFLGGQNYYEVFDEIAEKVDGKLPQETDQIIEGIFIEQIAGYINGEKTKEQAIDDFKQQTQIQLGLN